jgi:hypothetical protein
LYTSSCVFTQRFAEEVVVMSARLAEVERRLKVCLSELEGLRAERLALHGVSFPDTKTKEEHFFTSPEEWERLAKLALVEGKIKALEGEYTALRIQKVAAELDGHIEREIERAKRETSLPHQNVIGHCANQAVTYRLHDAEQEARKELRQVRIRYMTAHEREAHERRQQERRRERSREQEYGHER